MAEPQQEEVNPESLALRPTPKRGTRLNRKVIYGGSAMLLVFILGVVDYALEKKPPGPEKKEEELYVPAGKPRPEQLGNLPGNYDYEGAQQGSQLKPGTPILGQPLPGDVGVAMVESGKVNTAVAGQPGSAGANGGFGPNGYNPNDPRHLNQPPRPLTPEEQAARKAADDANAEIDKARTSALFFGHDQGSPLGGGLKGGSAGIDTAGLRANIDQLKQIAQQGAGIIPASAQGGQGAASLLGSLGNAGQGARSQQSEDDLQNGQAQKTAFAEGQTSDKVTSEHRVIDLESPYEVQAGTVIPAALVTSIDSDLPGKIIAQVTQNVYDSPSGRYLLIPQGARLFGTYDSMVSYGQSRALLVWNRLVFLDGTSIVLDKLEGADAGGRAGLEDETDYHWGRVLAGATLATVLDVGANLATGNNSQDRIAAALSRGGTDTASNVGNQLTRKAINIQPTIKIREGFPLNVIVEKDMILRPL